MRELSGGGSQPDKQWMDTVDGSRKSDDEAIRVRVNRVNTLSVNTGMSNQTHLSLYTKQKAGLTFLPRRSDN